LRLEFAAPDPVRIVWLRCRRRSIDFIYRLMSRAAMTMPGIGDIFLGVLDKLGYLIAPVHEQHFGRAGEACGDERALRQEMRALKEGLTGHIGIAAAPTALAMVEAATTPYRAASATATGCAWPAVPAKPARVPR
jgi:hypothetical protein